jgi:hypothetical protein
MGRKHMEVSAAVGFAKKLGLRSPGNADRRTAKPKFLVERKAARLQNQEFRTKGDDSDGRKQGLHSSVLCRGIDSAESILSRTIAHNHSPNDVRA